MPFIKDIFEHKYWNDNDYILLLIIVIIAIIIINIGIMAKPVTLNKHYLQKKNNFNNIELSQTHANSNTTIAIANNSSTTTIPNNTIPLITMVTNNSSAIIIPNNTIPLVTMATNNSTIPNSALSNNITPITTTTAIASNYSTIPNATISSNTTVNVNNKINNDIGDKILNNNVLNIGVNNLGITTTQPTINNDEAKNNDDDTKYNNNGDNINILVKELENQEYYVSKKQIEASSVNNLGNSLTDTLGGIKLDLGYTLLEEQPQNKFNINSHVYDNTLSYNTGVNTNNITGMIEKNNKYHKLNNNTPHIFMQKDFAGVANIFAPNIYISNPPLDNDDYPYISYSV